MKKIITSSGLAILLDNEDYDRFSKWTWYAYKHRRQPRYAYRLEINNGITKKFFLHKEIMNCSSGQAIDHINGNEHDNRKSNLRFCTPQQNAWNSRIRPDNKSGFKGVSWCKAANKWKATITFNKVEDYLGVYSDKITAAKAYNEAARKHFGEFAWLNPI